MFVGVFHGTSISALITGGSRCSVPLLGFGCEFGRGLIFLISNDWCGGYLMAYFFVVYPFLWASRLGGFGKGVVWSWPVRL
jgi:hypothetical protein